MVNRLVNMLNTEVMEIWDQNMKQKDKNAIHTPN